MVYSLALMQPIRDSIPMNTSSIQRTRPASHNYGPFLQGVLSAPHQQWQMALSTLALTITSSMPSTQIVAILASPSGPFPLEIVSNPHQRWPTVSSTLVLMITSSMPLMHTVVRLASPSGPLVQGTLSNPHQQWPT